jgi:hypothetical protein
LRGISGGTVDGVKGAVESKEAYGGGVIGPE